MAKRIPTVGIIGLGFGRAHIPAFQANGAEVVAVCQRDQATARAVADKYGVPRVFERWQDMLAEAHPEIVVIASPPHLHHAIALAAFAGGAHVLCEKPLAMTAAEGRDMVEAAARAGRIGMTCFNWRFPAAMQRFHAMVEAGHVGRPFHIGVRWLGGRWAEETAPATWRMDRAQAGHGAMGDMGVHVIDLLRWNFGEIARVMADEGIAFPSRSAPGVDRPADAEDFCTVIAELASGARATFTVSRVARGANEQTVECYGSQGGLTYKLDRVGSRWYRGQLTGHGGQRRPRARLDFRRPPEVDGRGRSARGDGQGHDRTARQALPHRDKEGRARLALARGRPPRPRSPRRSPGIPQDARLGPSPQACVGARGARAIARDPHPRARGFDPEPARSRWASRRVQLRGGARRPGARRTPVR